MHARAAMHTHPMALRCREQAPSTTSKATDAPVAPLRSMSGIAWKRTLLEVAPPPDQGIAKRLCRMIVERPGRVTVPEPHSAYRALPMQTRTEIRGRQLSGLD